MKALLGLLVALAPATAVAGKSFNAGNGATWDCTKDADVTVNASSGTYRFKGACKDIDLNGSGLNVTIESAKDLTVNGTSNTVAVTAADDINVNGSKNKVTYKKGISRAAPKVSNLGNGNTITAAAGGVAVAPTVTGSATVMDCATKKSISIVKGKGNYKLTGTCDKVAISGGDNTIVIAATKNLAVTGSRNQITVDKADKIATMGKSNKITYSTGLTLPAPKLATMGKTNSVTQAGVATATTTTTTTTTAAPAGAIDCGKTATHVIDGNDGTYRYVGKCELITIQGNNNTVTVDSAKGIYVAGNRNTILATAVDKLAIPGNDNKASWKKGVTTIKAKISVPGNRNKVSLAK